MNRQQRRERAKRLACDRKYLEDIRRECDRKETISFEVFFTAAGMALYNLYGWKKNAIHKVWTEMDRIITSIGGDETTFAQIKDDLEQKADIKIRIEEVEE